MVFAYRIRTQPSKLTLFLPQANNKTKNKFSKFIFESKNK